MPLIRIRDLKDGRETETKFDGVYDKRYEVKSGDLLIGMDGDFGCYEWLGGKALLNQRVCRLEEFSEKLEPKFLFYGINKYLKEIEDVTTYTTVKHLSSKQIANIELPLPPISDQRRIIAILDEAFAGLATATANAEKNLKNASELFDSYLSSVFSRQGDGWRDKSLREVSIEFGRGKSRHRPRNDPALYNGKYPFVQTGDVRNAEHVIIDYSQTYNEKGLAQSKLWPKGTICITIAANIAETGILGFEACFPDSVIGMVVDPAQANNKFVEYLLRFFKTTIQAQGKGSAQANINLATFENRKFPFPPVKIQNQLAARLDEMEEEVRRLKSLYQARLQFISDVRQSILQAAFSGNLGRSSHVDVGLIRNLDTKTASFAANVLIVSFERHRIEGRESSFGHTKAQKILHLVEAAAEMDMGRDPVKDAAGPNDFHHMLRAIDWAEQHQIFKFNKSGERYVFERLDNYRHGLEAAHRDLKNYKSQIGEVVGLLLPMNSEEAEVVATVYAAWNNLIIKSATVDDEAIVHEAREDWHQKKLVIARSKFFDAIATLRKKGMVPTGRAKLVRDKYLI